MVKEGLYYTEDHEWLKIGGDTGIVGISDYAQDMLGEITFIELPGIGKEVDVHGELAVVESSKAASDIYSPIAGTVTEVNSQLEDNPELLNSDCYDRGWVAKLQLKGEPDIKHLMDSTQYEEFVSGL